MNLSEFKKAMKGHLKKVKPKILENTFISIPTYTAGEIINDPDPEKKKLKEVMKRLTLYAMKEFKEFIKPKKRNKNDLENIDLKRLAEETIHEAWLTFEKNKEEGKYIETGKFEGYLKGIIDNLKKEYYRGVKKSRREIPLDYEEVIDEDGNKEIVPTINLPAKENSAIEEIIREAIENIKDEDLKEILKLKMYDRKTQEEIAKIKNLTIDVIKKMFHKAYAEFRKEWENLEQIEMKMWTPLAVPPLTTIIFLLIISLISWIFFRNPFTIYKIIGNWLDPYVHKILHFIFKVLPPLPKP